MKFLFGALAAGLIAAQGAGAAELTIGIESGPTSMDPHFHDQRANNALLGHVYDALVLQDEHQNLVPGLAVSWKAIDETTWEFKLRRGVRFHDGSPFTADDVLFTFGRAPDVPGSPSGFGLYTKGKTVTRVDDYTVRIGTEGPWPLVPRDLSSLLIVSRLHGEGATTADYDAGRAAIGTGRYKQSEYVPGERIVLERNEGWWGNKPEWTRVTFAPIESGPARVAALLAGKLDLIERTPTADLERLGRDPRVTLSRGISSRVIYLQLDQHRDDSPFVTANGGGRIANPLKDPRVRLAMSKAIQREAIVSGVMNGDAVAAGQLLPAGFFGVSRKLEPAAFDPAGAAKLLAEAGVGEGFGLTLHAPRGRYVNDAKIAEAIGPMLKRIGIRTEVVTLPYREFFKEATRGGPGGTPKFSFILAGWGSRTGGASSPLRWVLHTYDRPRGYGAANRGRYSSAEVDALLEEALATMDDGKRAALLARATEVAMHDVGVIPLHFQVNTWASRKGIGYRPRTDERTTAYGAFSQ